MRAENAQFHVQIKDRRTGTELFLRQQQRIMQHGLSWMSSELLEGGEFWLADMRIKSLSQICIDLAIEVFADYYNADLRMIFADALEDAGDPLCDSQRRVANIIRAVTDQREYLNSRLCISGPAHGRTAGSLTEVRLMSSRYCSVTCSLAGRPFAVQAPRNDGTKAVIRLARSWIKERFCGTPVTGPFCE